ncbi:hypothetical protein Tco_1376441 [Tanacetum coccineum]
MAGIYRISFFTILPYFAKRFSGLEFDEVSFLPGVIPIFAAWVYSECLEYKRSSSPSKEEHQAGEASHPRVIVGSVIAGCVLLALLVVDGLYAFRQKGRAERATKEASFMEA